MAFSTYRGGNVPKEYDSVLERRLERTIERIEGVTSAKVILAEDGGVSEIHLVSSSSRRPKQVVRDIESLLNAQYGIRVDYRCISLVQLSSENTTPPHKRVQFVSAQSLLPTEHSLQVTLQDENTRYRGVASLLPTAQSNESDEPCTRAAACATVAALQQILSQYVQLSVQEAQTVSTDDQQIALVIILAQTASSQERLTGTCIIGDSPYDAAAKATLDAVNRRLPFWATQGKQGS